MDIQFDKDRRKYVFYGTFLAGASLLMPTAVFANSKKLSTISQNNSGQPRTLYIDTLHFKDVLKVTYFNGRNYVTSETKKLDTLFRDRRSGDSTKIDPKLYDILHALQQKLGTENKIKVICGYRSPVTNSTLHEKNKGVAKESYHTRGQAADIIVEGVKLENVLKAALELNLGGVGYYPNSNFVHVDTGPIRHWPKESVARMITRFKKGVA